MNKTKKIVAFAVGTVMAATMVASLAGCGEDTSDVTINIAAGNSTNETDSISFKKLGGQITLPDGKTYQQGDLKPAWAALETELGITINDKWMVVNSNNNLKQALAGQDGYVWDEIDVLTSDLSSITADNQSSLLNLAEYLDQMPNFKSFLEANPVVRLSILSDTTTGAFYYTPYFDGNDDIERYSIVRRDWVKKLLNGTETYSNSGDKVTAHVAEAEMPATGKLTINSTNSDGTGTVNIVKNYDAALAAAKDGNSDLGKAYKAITGSVYTGASGNIVDIMNAAIAATTDGADGGQLVNLYRAYIDACYQTESGAAYYTAETRANVFNGYDAVWDADDLTAILRCVLHNSATLVPEGYSTVGIFSRDASYDRTPDLVRLAGILYGERGADSRYEYTYLTSDGTVKDMRQNASMFTAVEKMNRLTEEGLVYKLSSASASLPELKAIKDTDTKVQGFMMYDFNQTQTLNNFYVEDTSLTGTTVQSGYDFAPIVTNVANWDTDDDGTKDTTMRFTESWRSVKSNGWVVNANVANDSAKLKKVLEMIDYMYSNDGQILMTYGPMASNADSEDGFWYNTEATAAEIAAGNYFTYKGVKYSGTSYKGGATPTLTEATINSFKGKTVNDFAVTSDTNLSGCKLNFTNYARRIIGSCLPIGIVKDQGFENQLTSDTGKDGALKVATGLDNGTISHVSLTYGTNLWYSSMTSQLPFSTLESSALTADTQKNLRSSTTKVGSDKKVWSIYTEIIMNGLSEREVSSNTDQGITYNVGATASACVTQMITYGITTRVTQFNSAWTRLMNYAKTNGIMS